MFLNKIVMYISKYSVLGLEVVYVPWNFKGQEALGKYCQVNK